MNKILIHKGDSTTFADVNRFLTFHIQTQLNLSGWKAKFILGWITKEIEEINNKTFEVILTSEETKQLRLGSQTGSIILIDSEGQIKTVVNNIPFEVTTAVVENEYQEVDLSIPQSSGVDIILRVGSAGGSGGAVNSVNGMTGDVVIDIPSIEGLATEQQLKQGLDTKQNKGNYALVEQIPTQVSELENDSKFVTQTDVMQAIASIPQFKLSIVDALPETGEKMTLYFVPKDGEAPDIYNEYVWIEQTSSYEFLGSTAVDLTDYVKNTDYATSDKGGVVRVQSGSHGLAVSIWGVLTISKAMDSQIINKSSDHAPIVAKQIDLAVKTGVTTNTIELTDAEKLSARTWIGAVGFTEYASGSKGGVVRVDNSSYGTAIESGYLVAPAKTLEQYGNARANALIGKGTLDNVLTQYAKTQLITQADYDALETKDANTLYLIEE